MKKKVLVTYNMIREAYTRLIDECDVTLPPDGVESFTYDEVLSMVGEYDALLSMYNFPVDKPLLDAAPRLRIVSNYGVGFENIDVAYCTARGIQVTNTPDPVTEPTADQAMGLLLAVSRRIAECDRKLRSPQGIGWNLLDNLGHSLYGKQLGIVGMARIGQAMARRAIASGMTIVYYNRHRVAPEIEAEYHARYVSMDELLTTSDVVSLNAPHTSETHHIINADALCRMKKSSILVNTARGPLVDELALIEALQAGEIWGAGLDVFEGGHSVSPELLTMDNVVLNPHTGTQTIETRVEMGAYAADNIMNFFRGTGKVARVNQL